jgi:hypothetical protein
MMRYSILCGAAVAALALGVSSARAAGLLYSFETGDSPSATDGFAANGGGISVAQSNIGVTDGANSMRNSSVAGATFTGALTGSVPATLTNDTTDITLDLTINPGEQFTGAFADIGITIFGAILGPPETFGNQYQVDASSEQNIALAPGTYHLDIPLIGTSPVDFSLSQPFSAVAAQGFVPTGIEFFYSKSNDSAATVYIDNVQAVTKGVPEPTSMLGCAAFGGLTLLRRRRRA